jgi:hypothetical protein
MDTEGYLVGQAYIDRRHAEEGTEINVFPHPTREAWDKPYEELEVGDRLVVHSEATVVSRFMKRRRSRPGGPAGIIPIHTTDSAHQPPLVALRPEDPPLADRRVRRR